MRTEYLLQCEVDMVLAALTPENRLVMRVCLHTGLRLGDVLGLKTAQLAPHFWVTEQKTRKRKQIGLPEPLLSDLHKQAGKEWGFPVVTLGNIGRSRPYGRMSSGPPGHFASRRMWLHILPGRYMRWNCYKSMAILPKCARR